MHAPRLTDWRRNKGHNAVPSSTTIHAYADPAGQRVRHQRALAETVELAGDSILSIAELTRLMGVSRTTIWRMVRDGTFPRLRQISPNRRGLPASLYREWLASRRVA